MQERLAKKFALPVFASDAISSTAYATEEILLALVLAGTAALTLSLPVAIAVTILLVVVALSYQQTVHAYPTGGGSYLVSSENLGLIPGMIAAASLMVDYVMTVAVSVASGVAAITTAFPELYSYRVVISVALIVLVAVANLRGLRESGRMFAVPTYLFVVLCGGMIVVGFVRWAMGDLTPYAPSGASTEALTGIALAWIVLRAFAGGCSAMTGTEAISNAVPAFKPPESKNASMTLGMMAAILGFLLLGVTALAQILKVTPESATTVIGQVAHSVYGGGFFYYALQIATMAILVLAANTSFTGFPRLSSVLAHDGLMPRQFMNRETSWSSTRDHRSDGGCHHRACCLRADTHRLIRFMLWSVHELHPVADRHGGPLAALADSRVAAPGCDERLRGHADRHRHSGRHRHQVHPWRLPGGYSGGSAWLRSTWSVGTTGASPTSSNPRTPSSSSV
jgi:amino acid transporter